MQSTGERVRSVVIVGGGTAGWLSAAYLNRALSKDTRITVIESSEVNAVGVGEATIPTMRTTFEFLGLEEREWMTECNASFKSAIRFVNWAYDPAEKGDHHFYHPFYQRWEEEILPYEKPFFPELGTGFSRAKYWLKRKLKGHAVEPFAYACYPAPALCDAKLSPRGDNPADDQVTAYHFDAGLVAGYLRKVAKGRGVEHVVDHVVSVNRAENGWIGSLTTRSGRTLEADLYLDCSGFRGALINESLGVRFLSDAASLLCDSAIAIPCTNNPEEEGIPPYTTATALSSGWVWDIPLYHRNGCGYVYSSHFTSREEADREVRDLLGPRSRAHEGWHIKMRVGRNEEPWKHNCVAIGLAASFIEPLESTSIFMSEYQLATLVNLFPDRSMNPAFARQYNKILADRYVEIRDFIQLHYLLSHREDSAFWRAVHHEAKVPDSLAEKLDFLRVGLPVMERRGAPIFREISTLSVMAGLESLPSLCPPILDHFDDELGERLLANVRAERDHALGALPDLYKYLRDLHETFARDGGFPERSAPNVPRAPQAPKLRW